MVLDVLVRPSKVSGKPWEMYFIGIVYSLFAVILSTWIFKNHASLIMVTFTAIAAIPFLHRALELEEGKNYSVGPIKLFKEHSRIVSMFTFLFLGYVTVFFMLYLLLPQTVVDNLFNVQIDTIVSIRSAATGNFLDGLSPFVSILFNNIKIMFFCFIFSFFYGAGAIFIISWNASVMGAAIGHAIKDGIATGGGYFPVIVTKLTGYFLHGIPEMSAYFVAAVSGGIISVAAMKGELFNSHFQRVFMNAIQLLAVSGAILIVSGLVEVFISPVFLS